MLHVMFNYFCRGLKLGILRGDFEITVLNLYCPSGPSYAGNCHVDMTCMGLIFIDTLIIATPSRQTRKFYAQANNLCYYETLDIVPMMSSVCCLNYIAPTCTVLYGSTPHLVV